MANAIEQKDSPAVGPSLRPAKPTSSAAPPRPPRYGRFALVVTVCCAVAWFLTIGSPQKSPLVLINYGAIALAGWVITKAGRRRWPTIEPVIVAIGLAATIGVVVGWSKYDTYVYEYDAKEQNHREKRLRWTDEQVFESIDYGQDYRSYGGYADRKRHDEWKWIAGDKESKSWYWHGEKITEDEWAARRRWW